MKLEKGKLYQIIFDLDYYCEDSNEEDYYWDFIPYFLKPYNPNNTYDDDNTNNIEYFLETNCVLLYLGSINAGFFIFFKFLYNKQIIYVHVSDLQFSKMHIIKLA